MSTALYRRYRPENFSEVIGQEQVTKPLQVALANNKTNHAYLFSGPRGCGKTTSARILARCLNCAGGSTDIPCGKCPSCIDLSRDGNGSLDVIEIDAASHGGVDDARELRERATYAPARDKYKIFIIDEAHMVTSAGFNALLKIVEEPPAHIKFIFATTEPDKVIETIRSRTHHYPFRLVPPKTMQKYMEQICTGEKVQLESGVIPLVIRAGGGSVRDSLSILDQLINGSENQNVSYELAVDLLGYTHASLLNDVIDGISAQDAGSSFRTIDRIIQTGNDPRSFVEDLLERLRDLIVIKYAPESSSSILPTVPSDQLVKLETQATRFGKAQLSYCADETSEALNEMGGATSPRLHLELLCAKLLLPAASSGVSAFENRIERIEDRVIKGQNTAPSTQAEPKVLHPDTSTPEPEILEHLKTASAKLAAEEPTPETGSEVSEQPQFEENNELKPTDIANPASFQDYGWGNPLPDAETEIQSEPIITSETALPKVQSDLRRVPVSQTAPVTDTTNEIRSNTTVDETTVEEIRRRWNEVMQALMRIKRSSWVLINQNSRVEKATADTIELSFLTPGLAKSFNSRNHKDHLNQALEKILGTTFIINTVDKDGSSNTTKRLPAPVAPELKKTPAAPIFTSQDTNDESLAGNTTVPPTSNTAPTATMPIPPVSDTFAEATPKATVYPVASDDLETERPDPLKTPWKPTTDWEKPIVNTPEKPKTKPKSAPRIKQSLTGADLLVDKFHATFIEEIPHEGQ
ncbi:MAG: DNA polymerase III subunit gamma and tau [Micrococcaceae bacterium]